MFIAVIGCGGNKPASTAPSPKTSVIAAKKAVRFPKPYYVRGVYLTAWSAGSKSKLDKMIKLVDTTELNTLVIDIRDAGHLYIKTGITEAVKSGAETVAIVRPGDLMTRLEMAKVFPIARIACFRDNFISKAYPERCVSKITGGVWRDRADYAWLDPYNKQNWEYLAKIVDKALDLGFPEIQLDYVRFPSEGKSNLQAFPAKHAWPAGTKPEEVVGKFATYICDRVRKRGALASADIFGIISSSKKDQGIGQDLEILAAPFDLICPMVYPSHFAKGEYGVKDPNREPYTIILKTLRDYAKRLPKAKIRPWLQDFSLGVPYGVKEVQAQILAAKQIGYEEYLLWNAKNIYTEAAIRDNSKLANKPASPPAKTEATKF